MKRLWLSLAMSCFVAPAFAEFTETNDDFCDVDMMDEEMEFSEDELAEVLSSLFESLEDEDVCI